MSTPALDLRGITTHVCPCGEDTFLVGMRFEDYRPVFWWMDAECASCGSLLTAPCPADRPTGPNEDGY